MLLVHRRLRAQISVVKLQLPQDDQDLVRGHLSVWRLNPSLGPNSEAASGRSSVLLNPLVVTVAYFSPEGTDWNAMTGEAVFSALAESERVLLDARRTQKVDHVVIGHFNAHCSSLPVDLRLSDGLSRLEQIRDYCRSDLNISNKLRGRLELDSTEQRLILHRHSAKSAATVNQTGKRLVRIMEQHSMCPTSGLLGQCMPTSWIQCAADCHGRVGSPADRCATHSRMVNVNDLVFVDADLAFDALTSPQPQQLLKLVSRRIMWAEKIDHAVTHGLFAVTSPPVSHASASKHSVGGHSADPRRQSRRMRLPFDKHRRLHVQRLTGELLHDQLSRTQPSLSEAVLKQSICDRDAEFVAASKPALAAALRRVPPTAVETSADEPEQTVLTWRQSWRNAWRRHRKIRSLIEQGQAEQKVILSALNREIRQLFKQKQSEDNRRRTCSISASVTTAPKLHWKLLHHNAHDPGEPAETRCKLLDRLNNSDGKLLSTDKQEIRKLLLDHRKGVFTIRPDLSDTALSLINFDLHLLNRVNDTLLKSDAGKTVNADAAAAKLQVWCGRQIIPQTEPTYWDTRVDDAITKITAKRTTLVANCNRLEGQFTLEELDKVLHSMEDTGPGIDGVAVGSLTRLHVDTRSWMLDLFNDIWKSGIVPDSWADVRVVLHYKGKGSDPYCADNYRGLGIGSVLEKIMSLMMMSRLEIFLRDTNALHRSQGGFLPQRGPPEQVFTLSEAVRAVLKSGGAKADPVHLCFIDIERAYDSVQHVKLWSQCAQMGIGGHFLATLQAMYAGKRAVLDVDGELLEPQDIQCGVLQGNSLSPLLFNIYIDSVLRELDSSATSIGPLCGIPLPFFDRHGVEVLTPGDCDGSQLPASTPFSEISILISLFFADDGVLIARSRLALQLLLDRLLIALESICLSLNARKTKVLIVPPLSASDGKYSDIKKAVISEGGYQAAGRAIELVDEFMYLGVCLWYAWDWSRAWKSARQRANRMLYCLRQVGLQNRPAPLVYQLRFAASQVLSHLDYIAAIAGVESSGKKQIAMNDIIVHHLLCLIAGLQWHGVSADALKSESGTWDSSTRVRMLQLRFFSKLTLMDCRSTHFRALCLSRAKSSRRGGGQLSYYMWFDGVQTSAQYFDIPTHDPARFDDKVSLGYTTGTLQPIQTLVRVERWVADDVWESVDSDASDSAGQRLRVRAVHDGARRFDYSSGRSVTVWPFAVGTTIKLAWTEWSAQIREAAFAELRLRGNDVRQSLFDDTLNDWIGPKRPGQRDYAPLKNASYLEPYWFANDPHAARCLLRARTGYSKLEFDYRRAEHRLPQAGCNRGSSISGTATDASASLATCEVDLRARAVDSRVTKMHSLVVPHQRACYMCPVSTWMPETFGHVLLSCPSPAIASERSRVRAELGALIQSVAGLPDMPPVPDLANECARYFVLMLATSVGPSSHRQPSPEPAASLSLNGSDGRLRRSARLSERLVVPAVPVETQRLQAQWVPIQRNHACAAATWTAFLTSEWRRAIAQEREWEPAARAGAKLVEIVSAHHRRLIRIRRRALQINPDFLRRRRDPAVVVNADPVSV